MGESRSGGEGGEFNSRALNSGQHPVKQFQSAEYQSATELGGSAFAIPTPKLAASLPVPVKAASTMTTSVKELDNRKWNTSGLGLRIASDAAAAGSAAVLIAPIITAIDRGIMENASGRNTLANSLKASAKDILFRPRSFFGGTAFGLVFALYSGTYFTANLIDTANSTIHNTPITSTTAGTSKFLATSTSNLALCLYKDNRFTQMFGSTSSTARPVPLTTFALFTVRDCLTIFASFNMPAILSPHLDQRMSEEVKKYVGAASVAQFMTPAAVQLFSTPLHLLGLDLYNRPGMVWTERASRVTRDWAKSAFARMGRIIPAFGVGGVVNTKVRRNLLERLDKEG